MRLRLKDDSVKLDGLTLPIITALPTIMRIYHAHGMQSLTITSARDGEHKPGSLHYSGHAIDLRIWSLPDVLAVRDQIQDALGLHYDVVLESDHIHLEYDAKH